MKIIYRISDVGYNKVKPNYINNENCLKNASLYFKEADWLVIADNTSKLTDQMITKYQSNIMKVSIGHGAGTFNLALDEALKHDNNEIIYFLENDYLHLSNSDKILSSYNIFSKTFLSVPRERSRNISSLSEFKASDILIILVI
jgi:hypothetical protein